MNTQKLYGAVEAGGTKFVCCVAGGPANILISYICLDNDGRPIKNLMGTALDISQGGLLLETTQRIEPGDIILITAD